MLDLLWMGSANHATIVELPNESIVFIIKYKHVGKFIDKNLYEYFMKQY
jgi:hypothetical protein